MWAILSNKSNLKLRKLGLFCYPPSDEFGYPSGLCLIDVKGWCPGCMEDILFLGLGYTKLANGTWVLNDTPDFSPGSEAAGTQPSQYWKFILTS